jgi:hypothetical protein
MSLKNIVSQLPNDKGGITIGFQCRDGEIRYYDFSASDAAQIATGRDPNQLSGQRTDSPGSLGGISGGISGDIGDILEDIAAAAADAVAGL